MKTTPVYLIMALALILALVALFGDQSYSNLQDLQAELEQEQDRNRNLRSEAKKLKKTVWDIKHQPEAIEKHARDNYAMARKDDLVVFFND